MFVHELEINGKKPPKKQKPTLTEAVFASVNHIAWLPKWMTGKNNITVKSKVTVKHKTIDKRLSDPMFHNSYLGDGMSISVCFSDVHFRRTKRTFLKARPDKNLPDGRSSF